MKKLFAVAILLIPFALAGCSHPQPAPYPPPPPPPPPPAYSQAAEQGHHDGLESRWPPWTFARSPSGCSCVTHASVIPPFLPR